MFSNIYFAWCVGKFDVAFFSPPKKFISVEKDINTILIFTYNGRELWLQWVNAERRFFEVY